MSILVQVWFDLLVNANANKGVKRFTHTRYRVFGPALIFGGRQAATQVAYYINLE